MFDWLTGLLGTITDSIGELNTDLFSWINLIIRFLLPLLGVIIISRCIRSLLRDRYEGEEWGYLSLPNGSRIRLEHWENVIGRSKASDVFMQYPTLSRSHAALIRDDKGQWTLYDLESKGGVIKDGRSVTDKVPIKSGDVFNCGGVELVFVAISPAKEREQAAQRIRPGREVKQGATLLFLLEFQILLAFQLCISMGDELSLEVPAAFAGLIALTWIVYFITRALKRVAFEVETIAFFLCSIGFAVCASSSPDSMYKQLALLVAGIILYFGVGWFLRDLDRAKKLRWPAAAAGLLLLAVNLVASKAIFGAKNWLEIGGVSFQPSEFVKIAFVLAGAAALDRLFAKRNLLLFIAFAGACVGALALMSDFGTALVFFAAYLVIAYLRSGNIATVFLSVAGAGFAGFIAMTLKSHIAARFATWGHAWEVANDGGYQQTRTMAAAASGGLFGVGAGRGWLKDVFAADTDLVFGMVCEELGLILALLAVAALIVYAVFTIRAAARARSSFYVIGACAAITIMLTQVILNVLGSVDILPLTGVTFPFVSRGGSSLIACWGLLAFIKAVDTRQNASFVVKTPQKAEFNDADPVGDFTSSREPKYADEPPRRAPDDGGDATKVFDKNGDETRVYVDDEGTKIFKPRKAASDISKPTETPKNDDFEVNIDYGGDEPGIDIDDSLFK